MCVCVTVCYTVSLSVSCVSLCHIALLILLLINPSYVCTTCIIHVHSYAVQLSPYLIMYFHTFYVV